MDIRWLLLRIKKDYLFAPRYKEYRQILGVARKKGYKVMSLLEFYLNREELAHEKVLALRHDVDNMNPQGVRLFFELEKEFGVSATYYFRLKTLKMAQIAREILEYGSEVGYHFEEPASLAKQCGISSYRELEKEENQKRIDEMMERNIQRMNSTLGIQIRSLCSHNDFYNRRLGFENHAFLSNRVRQKFNILFEAYDPSFMSLFDECPYDVADNSHLWHDDYSPVRAMWDGVPKIYALTHPRQWHPAFVSNTRENMRRLFQELYYRSMELRSLEREKTLLIRDQAKENDRGA
jgi:hypothetical protein